MSPYIHMPPYFCMSPRGVHNPHMLPYSSMPLCSLEALHVVGGCNGLPFVLGHPPLQHPYLRVPPLYYTPTLSSWVPVHWYVSRISVCYVGNSLLSERVGGCFPHHLRVGVNTGDVHMIILVPILWCIMSHIPTMDPTTAPPVTVVSCGLSSVSSVTVAPSLTGFPVSLDQHGMAPPPPLMPRASGCVSWLSFCATAATSIFNASFSLCQLCYGFSTGRFLFQS